MTEILSGTCRYCHCAGDSCGLPNGDRCSWYDDRRTVCNAPSCVRQFENKRRDAKRAAKPRRLSSADVHAMITGRKKRKKGRAA